MYSIGEISKIVKISADALRYYDEIGLLKPIHIDKNTHYRYYSEGQVSDVLFIMELKQYGFSLDAIKELLLCKDLDRLKVAFITRHQQLSKEHSNIKKSMYLLEKRIIDIERKGRYMINDTIDNRNILVVDDSAFMRMMMEDFLGKHDYNVIGQGQNGEEGVKKYFDLKPAMVIMDIGMPELDGISAVKKIIEKNKDARIVMCSAKALTNKVLESLKNGACDFVAKPFQASTVVEAISKNLEEKACYNLATVEALMSDGGFNSECTISQDSINKLLDICKQEYNESSPDIEAFLNSIN